MSTKKELVVTVISGVMGLSTLLLSQNQFDSTQKIQQASVHENKVSKDDLGTFGMCGMGLNCSGGGGQCGMGLGCGGGGGQCGMGLNCGGR